MDASKIVKEKINGHKSVAPSTQETLEANAPQFHAELVKRLEEVLLFMYEHQIVSFHLPITLHTGNLPITLRTESGHAVECDLSGCIRPLPPEIKCVMEHNGCIYIARPVIKSTDAGAGSEIPKE